MEHSGRPVRGLVTDGAALYAVDEVGGTGLAEDSSGAYIER